MGDDASEDGFNSCECIWNHEMAMRRLLNVLRNSQNLCTDTECFEPGVNPSDEATQPENLYLLTFLIGIAFLFFFFRPRPQRIEPFEKPSSGNSNNPPPSAPPAI
ncbi:small integral membrane protein 14 [Euwallacea fornicatus]|uniref:small integral membrane protein 14 n=1 Tax=Euwallacea fornicatus TaxID=995702 RepID=UPI00338E797C